MRPPAILIFTFPLKQVEKRWKKATKSLDVRWKRLKVHFPSLSLAEVAELPYLCIVKTNKGHEKKNCWNHRRPTGAGRCGQHGMESARLAAEAPAPRG